MSNLLGHALKTGAATTQEQPYRDHTRKKRATDKPLLLSMAAESEHGAAYRDATVRSDNDFKRKLGHLKQALSTIKTNLSSFKQSASTKYLMQSSHPRHCS